MPPPNPFFHRGAIRQARNFFNREAETAQALTLLGNLQSVAVVGQRRIGKTSLLYHLARPETFTAFGLSEETTVFAYVDGHELAELDEAGVRGFLARRLVAEIPEGRAQVDLAPELTQREFRTLIEALTSEGYRLFLLLDEFEALAIHEALKPRFFSGLRALSGKSNLAFVTASHRSLFDLSYAHTETLSSPFFNIFAHLNLRLFTEKTARTMIETLAAKAGLSLSAETVGRIVSLAGPHPFLLQLAAFHACESLRAAGDEASLGTEWEHRFETEAIPHFEYYWNHLSEEERFALASLPFNREAEGPMWSALEEAAMIRRGPIGWTYLSTAFEEFLRRQAVAGLLQFGPVVLDLSRRQAVGSEGPLKITKTEFEALAYLLRNARRVISPEELETALWGEQYIEDPERVRSVIKSLRKALGKDARFLTTQWGEGYTLQEPS